VDSVNKSQRLVEIYGLSVWTEW